MLSKTGLLPCKKNNHFFVCFVLDHSQCATNHKLCGFKLLELSGNLMCSFYSLSDAVLPPGVWLSGLDSFPVSCPSYLAQLSELFELTAPADGSATAGAFHKKVGGACCSCFCFDQDVIFYDIEMRQCNAKDPGLNLKKVKDGNIFLRKMFPTWQQTD